MQTNPHFKVADREVLVAAEPCVCPGGPLTGALPYRLVNLRVSVRAWLGPEGLDLWPLD